jgi:hypothetical protein
MLEDLYFCEEWRDSVPQKLIHPISIFPEFALYLLCNSDKISSRHCRDAESDLPNVIVLRYRMSLSHKYIC